MAEPKVTMMVIKVDLQCQKCYKKIKKVLCKFPQIRDQQYDEKKNTVTIKVVCCNPEKILQKIRCKGGNSIICIEIIVPQPPKPTTTTTSKLPTPEPSKKESPTPTKVPLPCPCYPPLVHFPFGGCCRAGGPCYHGCGCGCGYGYPSPWFYWGYCGTPVYENPSACSIL